jgi:hypothetical protein
MSGLRTVKQGPNGHKTGAELSNPRHERFAVEIAKGTPPGKAFGNAGYRAKWADQGASRLAKREEVAARIAQLRTILVQGVINAEIGNRDARLLALQDRYDRLRRVIEARASDLETLKVPGGDTGLVVFTVRVVSGKDGKRIAVREHAVDAALLRELRAIEQQAAQEMGQLAGVTDNTGNPTGGAVRMVLFTATELDF